MVRYFRCIAILFILSSFIFNDAQAQVKRRGGGRYKYSQKKRGGNRGGSKRRKSYSKYRGSKAFISRARKYSYVGVNLNAFNYYGDIAPNSKRFSSDISFTRPGFGLHAGYQYKPNLVIRGEFNYGRITGDDNKGEGPGLSDRNLNFRNDIKELSIGVQFNMFKIISANRRPPFNPYFHISVAALHHEPYGEDANGDWVKLRPLGTAGQFITDSGVKEYKSIAYAIPVGVGVKMRLPSNFDLSFEVGGRFAFTDYLDDLGADKYPDPDQLNGKARFFSNKSDGKITFPTNETRGGEGNDFYLVTQFKLSYIFGAGSGRFGGRSSRGKFR